MKPTSFLARFLGLFLIIESLSMMAQKPLMLDIINNLIQNHPLLFNVTENILKSSSESVLVELR